MCEQGTELYSFSKSFSLFKDNESHKVEVRNSAQKHAPAVKSKELVLVSNRKFYFRFLTFTENSELEYRAIALMAFLTNDAAIHRVLSLAQFLLISSAASCSSCTSKLEVVLRFDI